MVGKIRKQILILFSLHMLGLMFIFDWVMAFCVQTLTGTVEKRTHRMERT